MNITEENVPNHTTRAQLMNQRNTLLSQPDMSILITTCGKDAHWLIHCLQSINKFAKSFLGVTLILPEKEADHVFRTFVNPMLDRFDVHVELRVHNEESRKGMIEHMIAMAYAPEYTGGQWIAHIDADCVLKGPLTPMDLFVDNRPYYIYRKYASLLEVDGKEPGKKVISDCFQWKNPTEEQLGFTVDDYTMCRFPFVFHRSHYKPYRDHIENIHGSYSAWMRKGKNEFPQNRMDFTAMGAFVRKYCANSYTWLNADTDEFPPDPVKAYWSHGGVTPEIEAELKGLLA